MQDIPFDFAFDIGSINAKCKENIAAAVSECENRIGNAAQIQLQIYP